MFLSVAIEVSNKSYITYSKLAVLQTSEGQIVANEVKLDRKALNYTIGQTSPDRLKQLLRKKSSHRTCKNTSMWELTVWSFELARFTLLQLVAESVSPEF